jgi:osmotically-inducible protein OsmY
VNDEGLQVREWAEDPAQRETQYTQKSPSEIRTAINDANRYDPRVMAANVEPVVSGTVVKLRGQVSDLKAKHAAAANARNTVGVERVVNRLKVRPLQPPTDEQVESSIENALARDAYVDRYEIDVNVVDGTAYLTGTVDSYFEKAQAEDVASRTRGTVDVSNALVVTESNYPVTYNPYVYDWYVYDYGWYDYDPTAVTKSDTAIREDIVDQMWWSPFVDSDEVTVVVHNGKATLTGTVDTYSERRAATENALEGGAISVDNDLKVAVY